MMKKHVALLLFWFTALAIHGQILNPVHFSTDLKATDKGDGEIVFTGRIDRGWHVYSTRLGGGGPTEASFTAQKLDGVELVGGLQARGNEVSKFDPLFNMQVRYFEGSVQFVQRVRFTKPQYSIDGALEYGACDDENCLPPTEVAFHKSGNSPAVAANKEEAPANSPKREDIEVRGAGYEGTDIVSPEQSEQTPEEVSDSLTGLNIAPRTSYLASRTLWYTPVVAQLQQYEGAMTTENHSLWYIFLMGLLGGALALFTPCVWPIIPMTVSFFLKRTKDRSKGIRDAITYGLAIIGIYLGLGLIVTALFGPDTLNSMSTNVWFNLFLFVLLVVFALSFFGWFEIRLPASWGNKVDEKAAGTTGLLSIFLMAFTLALVSFSCTAPIVGLLLVETVTSGNWVGPAIGMFGFALALALPFTLFALFPSWLKQAPKSGSWMNIIKVSLGFIELAFSLKFLSVADLAYGWRLLDREVFLALWIVIFGLLGLYLIGKLVFKSDQTEGGSRAMPVPCVMLGLVSLAFAVYMVPGLWGAPCKAVSAFAPPMWTQDFNLNQQEVRAHYSDYDQGMAAAAQLGKPVMLDFTGFGCVNCRKMEAAVWTDAAVGKLLSDDYVLISLFVDDKTPLAEPDTLRFDGEEVVVRTVGQKWSALQAHKFGANTQPFYVLVDNNGSPLAAPYSYNEDVSAYLNFLSEGLKKYAE